MVSLIDDIFTEIQSHPSEIHTPSIIFEKLLPQSIDLVQSERTDRFHQIELVTNFEGHAKYATTRKVGNIRLNLRNAVLDEIPDLIEKVSTVVAASVIPILIPIACLQMLRYFRNLATIQLTETDAVVLKELFTLAGVDRTVTIDSLGNLPGLSKAAVNASLPKLEELGCVSIIGNEVVINETIVFQQDT
jgi:hypothetical protein